MRMVGLTGGIASGKSTVSNLFKSHGIHVVDADVVARDVLKKGTGGYRRVVAAFGEDILQANGEVDRPKLGRIVFSDPRKRKLLDRLLARYISSGIFWEIFKLWLKGCKVIVLDIPLLFEAKMDKWTKPIVVVWVDSETQLQRLMARDKADEENARNRINAQMPLDLKRSKADIVIDNSGTLEELEDQFQQNEMAEKHPEEVAPEQQLKYQTWVLRVSIHCEGCRKKVKKVLKAIHGVYEMEIDPRQHKVTVTGNVEADTLLKKLTRSGKQAELWPLLEQNNDKKTANNINKERPQASDDHNKEDEDDDEDEDDHDQKNPGQAETGEKATVGGGSGAGAGNGGKKKKKKKKKKVGQSPNGDPNSASEGGGDGGPTNNGDLAPLVIGIDPGAVNQGLPIHHLYSHPPVYNYLPPPVYGSNYSTAYHSTSDSYYARQYPGQQARHVVLSYPERCGPPANPINTAEDVYYDNEMVSACSIM